MMQFETPKTYLRPKPDLNVLRREGLVFQCYDLCPGDVLVKRDLGLNPEIYDGSERIPCMHMYGLTEEGYSVFVNVYDMFPYFYVQVPEWFGKHNNSDCIKLQNQLNAYLVETVKEYGHVSPPLFFQIFGCTSNAFHMRENRYAKYKDMIEALFQMRYAEYKRYMGDKNYNGINEHMQAKGMDNKKIQRARRLRRLWNQQSVFKQGKDIEGKLVRNVELITSYEHLRLKEKSTQRFCKITCTMPTYVSKLRDYFVSGEFKFVNPNEPTTSFNWCTFESNMPFILRCLIDHAFTSKLNIDGSPWIRIAAENIDLVDDVDKQISRQSIEIRARLDELTLLHDAIYQTKIAPLRTLSFDIECANFVDKLFPRAERDPVIQIGCVIQDFGQPERKCIFTLDSCAPIANAEVFAFDKNDEAGMLMAFSTFFNDVNADILTGYNIQDFDLPYLVERALKIGANGFDQMSKLRGAAMRIQEEAFSGGSGFSKKMREKQKLEQRASKKNELSVNQTSLYRFFKKRQRPTPLSRLSNKKRKLEETKDKKHEKKQRTPKKITIAGVILMDMLFIIRIYLSEKLRSYTLNNVSAEFLGDQKDDMDYEQIPVLQLGTANDRQKLAKYCIKDSLLPINLINKLDVIVNVISTSRIVGMPSDMMLKRGVSIQTLVGLYRLAKEYHFLVPYTPPGAVKDKFKGATVIKPFAGYYTKPIATLDFASLYPSIIIANNLCYTTYITKEQILERRYIENKHYTVTPANYCFLTKNVREGLLPRQLKRLLGERSAMKKCMAAAKKRGDMLNYALYNGRQLALKKCANSIYGFTGTGGGQLPEFAISESVTAYGRQMIDTTKENIEKRYCKANGYEHDALVIYGDTDSVMVRFGPDDLATCFKYADEAGKWVTTTFFKKPNDLEFEKVYWPYLLIAKKNYAGVMWVPKFDKNGQMIVPKKPEYIDYKGLEVVRRDASVLTQQAQRGVVETLMIKKDVDTACNMIKNLVTDLHMNRVDMSKLVKSKKVSRPPEEYANPQVHVEVARKRAKRDPSKEVSVGTRVPYVMVRGPKWSKGYECGEDPQYVVEHRVPIDSEYYIEKHLVAPISRIMIPVFKSESKKRFSEPQVTQLRVDMTPKTAQEIETEQDQLRERYAKRRVNELFYGAHAKHRYRQVGGKRKGTIMSYFETQLKCMRCKISLTSENSSNQVLCQKCEQSEGSNAFKADCMIKMFESLRKAESNHARLWNQCLRCQGSKFHAVQCVNMDCPIWFVRTRMSKDIEDLGNQLKRFDM